MKFVVDSKVFEKEPNICIGLVYVEDVDNSLQNDDISAFLEEQVIEAEKKYNGLKAKSVAEVQPYREAFKNFGINPNRYMCSIEALIDRISKGKGFGSINPIVDLGNGVSLKYGIPIGAHDCNTCIDSLEVRPAIEGDVFVPFGGGDEDNPEIGEIVYVSGNQVRTRRWTWRQGERGKIGESTSSVIFPVDGFIGFNDETVKEAVLELSDKAKNLLKGANIKVGLITAENPEFDTERN